MRRVKISGKCSVVYIGSDSNIVELYDVMSIESVGAYNIAGYFDTMPNPQFTQRCKYLGCDTEIVDYLSCNKVDSVYCGLPVVQSSFVSSLIDYCEKHLIRFFSVPNLKDYCEHRMHWEFYNNVPLLAVRSEPLRRVANSSFKRLFDVVFSLCFLLTVFLPIYIVVGLITKLTSPGPILFKQKRHGLGGKEFYIYKFRSMRVNDDADTTQATLDDPRKTRFGDLLRRSSIDELPQFINVLRGDMSVVGPRPHMLKHTEEYSKLIDSYMVRHFVKPGLTGWAQVTGYRGETKDVAQMRGRIKADIWYLEHWRFGLDMLIIYRTAANIIWRKDPKAF